MTNYNDFLDNMEEELDATPSDGTEFGDVFTLNLKNGLTGKGGKISVYPVNTLGQIAEQCPKLIGTKHVTNSKLPETYVFEHGKTHKTTSDTEMTVAEFDLHSGDTLVVYDDSTNA